MVPKPKPKPRREILTKSSKRKSYKMIAKYYPNIIQILSEYYPNHSKENVHPGSKDGVEFRNWKAEPGQLTPKKEKALGIG